MKPQRDSQRFFGFSRVIRHLFVVICDGIGTVAQSAAACKADSVVH
jgi:hypothetical protein